MRGGRCKRFAEPRSYELQSESSLLLPQIPRPFSINICAMPISFQSRSWCRDWGGRVRMWGRIIGRSGGRADWNRAWTQTLPFTQHFNGVKTVPSSFVLILLPGCGKSCEANIKVGVTLIFIAFSYDPIKPSAARVPSSWWRNCGEAGEPRSGANGSLAVPTAQCRHAWFRVQRERL